MGGVTVRDVDVSCTCPFPSHLGSWQSIDMEYIGHLAMASGTNVRISSGIIEATIERRRWVFCGGICGVFCDRK
jgi:hypothetical protein